MDATDVVTINRMSETKTAPAPALALRDIRKSYGPVEVLHGVDFTLQAGEIHAVVGENGAGKSTLMSIIAGEQTDFTGSFELFGEPVHARTAREAQAAGIVLIHQHPTGLPPLSVAENVLAGHLPTTAGFVRWREVRRAAAEAMAQLGVDIDVRQPLSGLRPGQQQLVEIARALRQQPRVLILDEPTASLTSGEKVRLFEALRRIRQQGTAVVFISHHLSEVFTIADAVTIMRDGSRVTTVSTVGTTEEQVAFLMVGRELESAQRRSSAQAEPRLSVADLCVGDRLRSVTFDAAKGEVVGVTGLLGAGQHELVGALFGSVACRGRMSLDGERYAPADPAQAIRAGVALVTEDRQADGLLLEESVASNLALVSSFSRPRGVYRSKDEVRAAERVIDELRVVPADPHKPVRSLSGGNQQKVAIGKWLRGDYRVLILHEPTRGVDIGAKAQVHEIVRRLAAEGMTVLLVSSDLPEVAALSDRVLVLHRGALAAELDSSEVSDERLLAIAAGVPAREASA